jgi:hypothetical protein
VISVQIDGFFKKGPFEAAYVVAVFSSGQLGIEDTIEFLIDTGASRTTICDKDAIRLGIDYSKLDKLPEGTLGIGGNVDTYIVENPELSFKTRDGRYNVEKLDKLYVLKHERVDNLIKRLPSILGRDILNKYSLVYDRREEKATITDER